MRKNKLKYAGYIALMCCSLTGLTQDSLKHSVDTTGVKTLGAVIIEAEKDNDFGITYLRQVEGAAIYAGKKSEVILLENSTGNLATNNARQIYNKVAGLNIWENDGSGIQLGVGGRGLNPNRVSNFNTRQNGYDISADALGYPESYYTPPTEALDRIEIVRGAASLQYGTQFGGFINFRFKQPPPDKKVEVALRQTVASFGLLNTFVSAAGTNKKFSYFTFYQRRTGDGWRPNSAFEVQTAHASLNYQLTPKLKITTEYTYMTYLARQAGGLTDQQFKSDPRQSFRNRNWFRVNWNLLAVVADYESGESSRWNFRAFGLHAQRDALGFLGVINRVDPLTERDFLQDKFRNVGAELRHIRRYQLFQQPTTFLIGSRYYRGYTIRKQGLGPDGSDADFTYLNPDDLEHSDYTFPSENLSFFAENIFTITPRLTLTPGIRFEYIATRSSGYYNEQYTDLAGNVIYKERVEDNRSNFRHFTLAGLGLGYRLSKGLQSYINFSQNYRSINFNDMRIVNPNARVDPNLKDERGYSADMGVRGAVKNYLSFDLSVFFLRYNDRIGSVLKVDPFTYQPYRYRTNISDSRNIGMEAFAELDVLKLLVGRDCKSGLAVFGNLSIIDARYTDSEESAFQNKMVEFAPRFIFRSGITGTWRRWRASVQYSQTSEQYTDATNSAYAANAVTGIIPQYYIMDCSIAYAHKWLSISVGSNNLTDNMYFTRRAEGYPGPGIIPSDGRSMYVTLGIRLP